MSLDPNAPEVFSLKNSDLFEIYTEKNLHKASFQTVVNSLPAFLDLAVFPLVNVKAYGAIGNGIVDDTTAIQNAINAASALTANGGVVFFPDGNYLISNPLILPRSGVTPVNTVKLMGAGMTQTRITGSNSFPENRALIEWSSTVTRAWFQSITNMSFFVPNVAGVMAIHYEITDKSSIASVSSEWMQIELNNIRFLGNNQYCERFVYLEGGQRFSTFTNLYGDPSLNANGYNTILLEFETTPPDDFIRSADAHGLFMSKIENCHTTIIRGGKSALLKGRFLSTEINRCFCDGGSGTPCFDFVDSSMVNLTNVATEGRNEQPQYRFTNCDFFKVENISIGTPDNYYDSGLGNGLELINCNDMKFDMRWITTGKPSFSSKGTKVVTIDANCKRCNFTNWGIRSSGTPADEFTVLGGNTNTISYIDFNTTPQTTGTITGS